MGSGPGAKLEGDWWVWKSTLGTVLELVLGDSGVTVSPWTLCRGKTCLTLGKTAGPPIHVRPCPKGGG